MKNFFKKRDWSVEIVPDILQGYPLEMVDYPWKIQGHKGHIIIT